MTKDIRDKRAQEIAVRVREVREKLNLSQKELASQLNISGPTISEIENGKLFLNFEFMYNINRKYRVSLNYLMFGEDEMFEEAEDKLTLRLNRLIKTNPEAGNVLDYFEKSGIVRHAMVSRFISIMTQDKDIIEKEILNNKEKDS